MLFLYRFFCGVLEVEFYGIYPEKVLNICSKSGINIWSARYVKQRIRCKMLVKDFLKLPAILRKSGIRVHIIDKKGFPFFIKRYNKRFGVFSGIIVFFVFLYVMSGHIWVIEVEGLKTVKEQEIIASCQELGIHTGMSSKNIKAKALAQELLLKCDKLAWASLNVEGSCLTVNVTEIKQKQEEVKKLAEKFKDASLVLLTNYRGINVADDTALRKNLRKVDAEYVVIKNNITRRALEECGITDLGDALVGPTAVVIAKDAYLPALKEIYKYSKDNEFYTMKGGVLEGKVSSIEELTTLAQLPSREELIAKLAGCLLANVSKLAATLDAVRVKKESEVAE